MGTIIWKELGLLLRLFAGMAAGIVVGWERTNKQRAAGIRTFGLVGLGTAAAATIFSAPDEADAASRVVQGLLTGIGFLGASRRSDALGPDDGRSDLGNGRARLRRGSGRSCHRPHGNTSGLVLPLINHSVERPAEDDQEP